jgi:hypothetical protein
MANRIDYSKNELASHGRDEDEFLAHVATGEMVVPPVISDDLRDRLFAEMEAAGLNPHEYTVGSGMSINPITGHPEFGFFKKVFKSVGKVVKKVIPKEIAPILPAAISFIPGIGPVAGAAIGATLGSANGIKGALLGGLSGGLGAGGATRIVNAVAPGLGTTAAAAAARGLTGAAAGAASGKGIKGALIGGALGAGSAYLPTGLGGVAKTARAPTSYGPPAPATAGSYALGSSGSNVASNALSGGGGGIMDSIKNGISSGMDVLSGAGKSVGDFFTGGSGGAGGGASTAAAPAAGGGGGLSGSGIAGSIAQGLAGAGLSSFLSPAADIYSGVNQYQTQEDIERQLLEAQGRVGDMMKPYMEMGTKMTDRMGQMIDSMPNYSDMIGDQIASGELGGSFDMQDFTTDPGYEFRKQQGEEAAQRQLSAMGMSQSGAAVKRAMELNQGLADQAYGDAFGRWQQEQALNADLLTGQQNAQGNMIAGQQGIGLGATGATADSILNSANISAGTSRDKSNIISQALSKLFAPKYDEDGNLIYA